MKPIKCTLYIIRFVCQSTGTTTMTYSHDCPSIASAEKYIETIKENDDGSIVHTRIVRKEDKVND